MLFIVLFAVSRWPGLFPPSFSAAYALAFCAGVYLRGAAGWAVPLGTLLVTDVALNFYYTAKGWNVWDWSVIRYQLVNYLGYAALIFLGRRFNPQKPFFSLLGGGIFGALIFYLITNTASWLFNPFNDPEYAKTFSGWLIALVKGTGGWPQTWEFFRNTLLSGALFTALFVGAEKMASAESPADKTAGAREDDAQPEAEEASA